MKRALRIGGLVALVALIGGFFLWRQVAPPSVELVRPVRGPAVEAVYATGVVEPEQWARVAPTVTARVMEVLVQEGDHVAAGDVLARLDDRIEQARVAELEARLRYLEAERERRQTLTAQGVGSRQALESIVSELGQVRAALEGARQRLAEHTLKAPLDGTVLRRDVEPGEVAPAGQVLFWVGPHQPLIIEADVDEADIPRVAVGQVALVRTDAFERIIRGRVKEITPKGDPINQTYRVRIALPDENGLMVGMTTEINIVVAERPDALLVPADAVRQGRVWTVENGRAVPRAVEVGVVGDGKAEIRSGLAPDTPVIAQPPADLKEGQRVAPE